jgi:hypothetical protein
MKIPLHPKQNFRLQMWFSQILSLKGSSLITEAFLSNGKNNNNNKIK